MWVYTRRQLAGMAFAFGLLTGLIGGLAACAPTEEPCRMELV